MSSPARPLPEDVARWLSPFFPGFDLSRIRLHDGIPRYVIGGVSGYASRDHIYLAPEASRLHTSERVALIAHEIMHCQQYRRHGTWRFRARYLAAYVRNRLRGMRHWNAYREIPFEIEAREIEAEVSRALRDLQPWRR